MCRRRFSLSAVASSDGTHIRISHDKKANTTGRTPYSFCGKPVIVSTVENSVLDATTGRWLGYLYVSDNGTKHVYGPMNKGMLNDSRIHI